MTVLRNFILLSLASIFCCQAVADNLRKISSREGISNNSILSINQDDQGYVYLGTCDGLDVWNGQRMSRISISGSSGIGLSGNLIESLIPAGESDWWVRTNYGLDLMRSREIVENHREFSGIYYVMTSTVDKTIVLMPDDSVYRYDPAVHRFVLSETPAGLSFDKFLTHMISDSEDVWVCQKDGLYRTRFLTGTGITCLDGLEKVLDGDYVYAATSQGKILLVEASGRLFFYDVHEEELTYCTDISGDMSVYGPISDMIFDGNDILVSYYFNGVLRLIWHPEKVDKWEKRKLDIGCGVFALMKDRYQDIIWVATDGQGLYMYAKSDVAFKGYTHSALPFNLSKPVRAILKDSRNCLWIGTKGEGILRIRNFHHDAPMSVSQMHHITGEPGLSSPAVYAFEESSRGLIWVGTEGVGIDWWSHRDRRFRHLEGNMPSELKWVHAIHESHRDTLWVASVGCGIFRLTLDHDTDLPHVKNWEKLDFDFAKDNDEFFFSMYADDDGTLWFGNRGGGLVHYKPQTGESSIFTFESGRSAIANDVWAIERDDKGQMWIGTSYGLLGVGSDGKAFDTPVKHTVHGIVNDSDSGLWLTTNRGLLRYDSQRNTYVQYGYSYGIETIEYSDGAIFHDEGTDTFFFGGTNGFVVTKRHDFETQEYNPPLMFRSARIDNDVRLLSDHDDVLTIAPEEHLSSIEVLALDYVNGSNYIYSYNIQEVNDRWLETSPDILFADLPSGKYTINARYKNTFTGYESDVVSMTIRIRPPWYATVAAKCSYVLVALIILYGICISLVRRSRKMKETQIQEIQTRIKEEALESRIHIMENFTQELSAPVTMISALAQQIKAQGVDDSDIREYLNRLLLHGEKLEKILSTFHYFSESSDARHAASIKVFSVSDLISGMFGTYVKFASRKGVQIDLDMGEGLFWSTDPKRLVTIFDSLMTNAVVHASQDTGVSVRVFADESDLSVEIMGDGDWIRNDGMHDIPDMAEESEALLRAGDVEDFPAVIRLSICTNLVSSLGGRIAVRRDEDSKTRLLMSLPYGLVDEAERNIKPDEDYTSGFESMIGRSIINEEQVGQFDFDENRQLMYILGNDTSMINLVAEIFSKEYNVTVFRHVSEFSEGMRQSHPDIIICENLYMRSDLAHVISSVKADKKTFRIPVVLLTTMRQISEVPVEGGADLNISVPFNVKYLKSAVRQSLHKTESMKEYFKSSVSVYDLVGGKLLHREDKEFIDRMLDVIRDNISNPDVTTAIIAEKMNVSVRKLYHKLDECISGTPSNILKEYRLLYAEKLLVTTRMSIDEIIYKSGFANRGTFFKNFSARYGCTPRQYRQSKAREALD